LFTEKHFLRPRKAVKKNILSDRFSIKFRWQKVQLAEKEEKTLTAHRGKKNLDKKLIVELASKSQQNANTNVHCCCFFFGWAK
jgi:hypothetical protein